MKRSTLMTQNRTQKPCEIVAFLCCGRKKRILYWIFQLLSASSSPAFMKILTTMAAPFHVV